MDYWGGGGAKGMLAHPSKIIGGPAPPPPPLAPPLPTPMHIRHLQSIGPKSVKHQNAELAGYLELGV